MLKRDLGKKDTGTLFGPHGGILDRLDAVLFTVVVGYYLAVKPWSTENAQSSAPPPGTRWMRVRTRNSRQAAAASAAIDQRTTAGRPTGRWVGMFRLSRGSETPV